MSMRDSETEGGSSEPLSTPPRSRNAVRGSACRFCRQRRIRCSADIPTCVACKSRKQECVYDYKKGPSKMQRLEKQVKEITEQLRAAGPPITNPAISRSSSISIDVVHLANDTRDHLLRVFFEGMRILAQGFHQQRFFAKLALSPPEQPHPCLIHAMCALAAHISTSEMNRHGQAFYDEAAREYEVATRTGDRLLDAVRAVTMLAVYDFSIGRYHDGWLKSGSANRLAISCGLHQIRSIVYAPSTLPSDVRVNLLGLMRHVYFLLPAPDDAVDLGERIWAFWFVYMNDHGTAICTQWPVGIPDSTILTPLPQPLHKHEMNLVTELDNTTVGFNLSNPSLTSLMFQGLSILERAYKLQYAVPESGSDAVDFADWNSILAFLSTNDRSAQTRTPIAFEHVKLALNRIEAQLPPTWQSNWLIWDYTSPAWDHESKETRQDAYALHFVIGCAWMFLYDVFAFGARNDIANNVALRLAHAVKLVKNDTLSGEFEAFILMTWTFVAKILLREERRLADDQETSLEISPAIETCLEALDILGKRHFAAADQSSVLRCFRGASAEDTEFLREALDHEHHAPKEGAREFRREYGMG